MSEKAAKTNKMKASATILFSIIVTSLIFILMLTSCSPNDSKETLKENGLSTTISEEEKVIQETLFQVDSLLEIDNGKFWNHQLYGPILFINQETRVFKANRNNSAKSFKKVGTIYSDTLPNEINIANTAINWNNERWTMVMLPLPSDKTARNNLVIHELFHRIQLEIGFTDLQEISNGHLDTYEGRLLLKLELEALKKALAAHNAKEELTHLKNALIFRNKRQSDDERKAGENSLEINEGLAEYTTLMLSGRNAEEIKSHLTSKIDQFYTNPTFVRSFAYQTIPLYGYLLSKKVKNWQRSISRDTNLTDYFVNVFSLKIRGNISYEAIAKEHDYDFQSIVKKEKAREDKRLARIAAYKKKFLEEPTLTLLFEKMNISFDPRNITPLENIGIVYPTLRVTDNWGILTVENGALLASNWGNVIVSAPIEINPNVVNGDGWRLELNKGWTVVKIANKYVLKKE